MPFPLKTTTCFSLQQKVLSAHSAWLTALGAQNLTQWFLWLSCFCSISARSARGKRQILGYLPMTTALPCWTFTWVWEPLSESCWETVWLKVEEHGEQAWSLDEGVGRKHAVRQTHDHKPPLLLPMQWSSPDSTHLHAQCISQNLTQSLVYSRHSNACLKKLTVHKCSQ